MTRLDESTLAVIQQDQDEREALIRRIVYDTLASCRRRIPRSTWS